MTDKELIETFLQVMRAIETHKELGLPQDSTADAAAFAKELCQRRYDPTNLDDLQKRVT